jgi:hypothetical protein
MNSGVIETKQVITTVSTKAIKLVAVATQDISAFSVMTETGQLADSRNVFHKNIIMGITISPIATGFSGTVVTSGQINNPLWNWTRGDILFLNETEISNICPSTGFRVIIGRALDQHNIDVEISESILF